MFTARKSAHVLLHDEDGVQIGEARLRPSWTPPDEEQAEALRRVLPLLGEFGIREVEDGEPVAPLAPAAPSRTRKAQHVRGPVTSTARAKHEEEASDGTQ